MHELGAVPASQPAWAANAPAPRWLGLTKEFISLCLGPGPGEKRAVGNITRAAVPHPESKGLSGRVGAWGCCEKGVLPVLPLGGRSCFGGAGARVARPRWPEVTGEFSEFSGKSCPAALLSNSRPALGDSSEPPSRIPSVANTGVLIELGRGGRERILVCFDVCGPLTLCPAALRASASAGGSLQFFGFVAHWRLWCRKPGGSRVLGAGARRAPAWFPASGVLVSAPAQRAVCAIWKLDRRQQLISHHPKNNLLPRPARSGS